MRNTLTLKQSGAVFCLIATGWIVAAALIVGAGLLLNIPPLELLAITLVVRIAFKLLDIWLGSLKEAVTKL